MTRSFTTGAGAAGGGVMTIIATDPGDVGTEAGSGGDSGGVRKRSGVGVRGAFGGVGTGPMAG